MQHKSLTVFAKKLFEIFIINIALSLIIAFFHWQGILSTVGLVTLSLVAATAIFLVVHVRSLRMCYFNLVDAKKYYIINLSAYAIFALVSILAYFFLSTPAYTWLFCQTKFIVYIFRGMPRLVSILIYHLLGFLSVIFSPVGMKWVFSYDSM